jgi:catechol 2,3-dioxygenase-like lactoylglutathione lyase family enzyme
VKGGGLKVAGWRSEISCDSKPGVHHWCMANQFRLSDHSIIGFVAVSDPERARDFYGAKLGLPLIQEQLPFALVYDAHGTTLRVTVVRNVHPAGYTVLGWNVPDIITAAQGLAAAGIKFERYPGMQDELGIWASPDGGRVAWFKDPDGNTLSISQHK